MRIEKYRRRMLRPCDTRAVYTPMNMPSPVDMSRNMR